MRLMFDIEFNLGVLLACMLTSLAATALIIASTPQRPMREPDAVINLSDTDESSDGEDEVDTKST